MRTTLPFFLLACLLICVTFATALGQPPSDAPFCPPDQFPGEWDADAHDKAVQDRFASLVNAVGFPSDVPGIVAELTPEKAQQLYSEEPDCEACGNAESNRIGINIAVGSKVSFRSVTEGSLQSGAKVAGPGRIKRLPDGRVVWSTRIECPNAGGLRVHFTDFNLPDGFEMFLYTEMGEAFGPYAAKGPLGKGEFWSNSATGSTAYLALLSTQAVDSKAIKAAHFNIEEVAYMKPGFLMPLAPPQEDDEKMLYCIADASCYDTSGWADIDNVRSAVALMVFSAIGSQVSCSGGLIVDAVTQTYAPYFLTANHCINSQSRADTLECVWRFRTALCGVGFVDYANYSGFPRTLGATLLSTGTVSDYCLLLLTQDPPAGSWSLGWDTAVPPLGSDIYRIAHPLAAPQSLSVHRIAVPISTACLTLTPTSQYIYSYDLVGSTDGGSSGSPVMLPGMIVVGQLFGVCRDYPQQCDLCNTLCTDHIDGRFSITYNYVFPWLDSTLLIKSPNGGGTWTRGTKVKATWAWSGLPGAYVRLALWRNGQFVRTIKSSTPNDGKQSYKVPANLSAGTGYKVRVVATTNPYILDDSNTTFTIN